MVWRNTTEWLPNQKYQQEVTSKLHIMRKQLGYYHSLIIVLSDENLGVSLLVEVRLDCNVTVMVK